MSLVVIALAIILVLLLCFLFVLWTIGVARATRGTRPIPATSVPVATATAQTLAPVTAPALPSATIRQPRVAAGRNSAAIEVLFPDGRKEVLTAEQRRAMGLSF